MLHGHEAHDSAGQPASAAAHLLGQRLSKVGVQILERLVARGGIQPLKLSQQEAGVDQQALPGAGVALAHLQGGSSGGERAGQVRAGMGEGQQPDQLAHPAVRNAQHVPCGAAERGGGAPWREPGGPQSPPGWQTRSRPAAGSAPGAPAGDKQAAGQAGQAGQSGEAGTPASALHPHADTHTARIPDAACSSARALRRQHSKAAQPLHQAACMLASKQMAAFSASGVYTFL